MSDDKVGLGRPERARELLAEEVRLEGASR